MILNIFCCTYLPSLYSLHDISSCHLLIFQLYCLLTVEFWELPVTLDTSSLTGMWFADISSQCVAWFLFFLFTWSFTGWIFHFDKAQFINFFLLWIAILMSSLRILCQKSQRFYPIFSKSFMVLCFQLKSVIHFELNFIWGEMFESSFFYFFPLLSLLSSLLPSFFLSLLPSSAPPFLIIDVQLLWHVCCKATFLPLKLFCNLFQTQWACLCSSTSRFCTLFFWTVVHMLPVPHRSDEKG